MKVKLEFLNNVIEVKNVSNIDLKGWIYLRVSKSGTICVNPNNLLFYEKCGHKEDFSEVGYSQRYEDCVKCPYCNSVNVEVASNCRVSLKVVETDYKCSQCLKTFMAKYGYIESIKKDKK